MAETFELEGGQALEIDTRSARRIAAEICRLSTNGAPPARTLGLGNAAPAEALVRSRFKKLAVLLHPDKQNRVPANADSGQPLNGSEAAEAFRAVNEAVGALLKRGKEPNTRNDPPTAPARSAWAEFCSNSKQPEQPRPRGAAPAAAAAPAASAAPQAAHSKWAGSRASAAPPPRRRAAAAPEAPLHSPGVQPAPPPPLSEEDYLFNDPQERADPPAAFEDELADYLHHRPPQDGSADTAPEAAENWAPAGAEKRPRPPPRRRAQPGALKAQRVGWGPQQPQVGPFGAFAAAAALRCDNPDADADVDFFPEEEADNAAGGRRTSAASARRGLSSRPHKDAGRRWERHAQRDRSDGDEDDLGRTSSPDSEPGRGDSGGAGPGPSSAAAKNGAGSEGGSSGGSEPNPRKGRLLRCLAKSSGSGAAGGAVAPSVTAKRQAQVDGDAPPLPVFLGGSAVSAASKWGGGGGDGGGFSGSQKRKKTAASGGAGKAAAAAGWQQQQLPALLGGQHHFSATAALLSAAALQRLLASNDPVAALAVEEQEEELSLLFGADDC